MPRYYCDYCDTYLTHDSPSVRKQHNAGYKHKANVRTYYQQFEEQQTQSLIDQKIKEHLSGQAAFQQVGVAFNQHLASVPALPRPRLPILPPPGMPMGAPSQAPLGAPMIPGVRPPGILPPAPGYAGMPPMFSVSMPPGAAPMPPPMPNGLPLPQNANVFGGHPGAYLPNPSSTVSAPNVGPPASLPQTSSSTMSGHVYAAPPQP